MEILAQLTALMQDVFDEPGIKVGMETTAKDIDEWNSISHIQLVVEIERHYKIKFKSLEIQSWQNVGDIVKSIESRLNK